MNQLEIADREQLAALLEKVAGDSETNWVRLSYVEGKNNTIEVDGSGNGGLKEFVAGLDSERVQFGVLEFAVQGDQYNTAKNILVTWLGADVPGGLAKARAAAHRKMLRDVVQESLNVAAELQASTPEELNEEMVGQALSRTRGGVYATAGTVNKEKKTASKGGSGTGSALNLVDEEQISAALKEVADKGVNHWCILAYVKDKKDQVEFIGSGAGGLEELGKNWPPSDRAYFCYAAIEQKGKINSQTKYVLVTLIGDGVSPLARARTSGQRSELISYIKASCPYHTEYQPNDVSDLNDAAILVKFK